MARFEVGMEVLVNPRSASDPYKFSTVAKITPSGRIVTLADGRKFNGNDGREYGYSSDMWRRCDWIEPLTDQVRQRIAVQQTERVELKRRVELSRQIEKTMKALTADQLQQVADLIATFPRPE